MNHHRKIAFHSTLLLSFCMLIFACKNETASKAYSIEKTASSSHGMVVTAHPLASEVGVEILKKGGNAADAAIAVQLALAVVYPRAGNIGGGGFLMYRDSLGKISALDYREKAPIRAERDMYIDPSGKVNNELSREGILSVGVPGTVAGLVATHKKLGRLPWQDLVKPAIALAKKGFHITDAEAQKLNTHRDAFLKYNPPTMPFLSDEPWKAGDKIVQKELAATLELIAEQGHDGFYSGINAERLLKAVDQWKGLIRQDDLTAYLALWRVPWSFPWREYEIHTMPPPSSGGVVMMQVLNMVDKHLTDSLGARDPGNIHVLVEAERRAYRDRAQYLGDADFHRVPLDSIRSMAYINNRFKDFDPSHASLSDSLPPVVYREEKKKETLQTTHISIVDQYGNAASVTTTLNDNYGSKVWVPEGGYFLNNEMDDFTAKPGEPNLYGLIGGEANAIEPTKRMLSSMTPTIVEKYGNIYLVLGTPGGSTIITSVIQVILNKTVYNMSIEDAVQNTRYHHQWLPNEIVFERDAFTPELIAKLESLGHHLREVETIGAIEAIYRDDDGVLHGVADRRGDDHAATW